MGKKWMTGSEVLAKYGLIHAELLALMREGLAAFDFDLQSRYLPLPEEMETGKMYLTTPKQLESACFQVADIEKAIIPPRAARQEIDPRERKTLLAVIAALVCKNGPEDLRDRALVGKIVKSLDRLGIARDDDTVRRAIKQVIDFMEEEKG